MIRLSGLGQVYENGVDVSIPPVQAGYTRTVQNGVVVDTPNSNSYGQSVIIWGSPNQPTTQPTGTGSIVYGGGSYTSTTPGSNGSGAGGTATTGSSGVPGTTIFGGAGTTGTGLGPFPGIPGLDLTGVTGSALPNLNLPSMCTSIFGTSGVGQFVCTNIFWFLVGGGVLFLFLVLRK